MAQPTAIQYLGAERITAGVTYLSADIITKYGAGTNVMQAKIDHKGDEKTFIHEFVRVSINGSPMFHFEDGEYCYIATGQSFVFDQDFTAAIGKYVAI